MLIKNVGNASLRQQLNLCVRKPRLIATGLLLLGLLLPLTGIAQTQRLAPGSTPGLWDGSKPGPRGQQRAVVPFGTGALLDFEGLGNQESVLNFYNGGFGGSGSGPGPAFGTTFTANGLSLTGGNYSNNPSPPTILFWVSGANTFLNRAQGFTDQASFFYSAAFNPGSVTLHSEINGGGTLLATVQLPITPTLPPGTPSFNNWQQVIIPFAGIARSIGFGGTQNGIGFDDVVLGNLDVGFDCATLSAVVGEWGVGPGGCGNFVSNATTARYESAMYEFAPAQLRGSLPGEYVYEVELLANRPRQPSAASSLLVAGSPLPLQTATRNWNRAIAFNISHNGRYSIFSYNGPGLPVALQRWVTPVGVAINRAPLSNTLTVARVQNNVRAPGINAVSSHNLLFSINDVLVRSLPDTYGVDQFGVGFVRSVVTNGDLMSDDWLEVLGVTLNNPVPTATGQLDQQVSRAQQDANDAANARRDNADPLFAPKEGR